MSSLSEEDEQFFDSKEYVTPVSDSGSDRVENSDSESRGIEGLVRNFGYEVWIRSPEIITKRREKFMRLMGLGEIDRGFDEINEESVDCNRVMENSEAVLRSSFREAHSSSQSSISCCLSDTQEVFDMAMEENLVRRIRNLDDGTEFIVDELGNDGLFGKLREEGSNRPVTGEEFEKILGLSPLVQSIMRRDYGMTSSKKPTDKRKSKNGWLKRLGVVGCVANTTQAGIKRVSSNGSLPGSTRGAHIVKVRTNKKRSKEFSALYMGQDIVGHKGAILTMKFSLDGEHLASAGEDGVVRVWEVVESERSDLVHGFDYSNSNVYFAVNHLGELEPINVDKAKMGRLKSLRKSSESACVIFPRRIFQLVEKPLHEFHGHTGEVLDLSWSSNKSLLSSSVDKTVRLWRVGIEHCLKVFTHYSFVTCVEFNPDDENYCISGSVDGKVRIWSTLRCEVVDWRDIKEIVTAVCYQPDGKGAIVGSITGDCYFYDTSDNRLQITKQISLHGKKKTPFRRITGFQFSPDDPSTLMVTTADSQVRLLKGIDVICKYKGLRNSGSQISATFTSNTTHIISASEDSFIYIWDSATTHGPISSNTRSKYSCERFFSNNASVAIPWRGPPPSTNPLSCLSTTSPINLSEIIVQYPSENGSDQNTPTENPNHRSPSFFSSETISLGFPDPFSRGVATWPEEKLSASSNSLTVSSTTCKSEYRFLKTTCQNMAGSPQAWGLVIVTAGWDGRIRVFQNYGLPVRL